MNPTYTKVPADFLYKGERLMSDAEWDKKQKKLAEENKIQTEKKEKEKKREQEAKRAKEDKERKDNRCPHCGQDKRSGDTGDTKVEEEAEEEARKKRADSYSGLPLGDEGDYDPDWQD